MSYSYTRKAFCEFCEAQKDVVFSLIDLNLSSQSIFLSTDTERIYGIWKSAWDAGFQTGEKKDTRMGIHDQIDPSLITKRLRDWA